MIIKQKNNGGLKMENDNKIVITKDMPIAEIIEKKPEAASIMFEYGLHCIGCRVAAWESLEEGCKVHGIEGEKLDEMLKKINELE